MALTVNSIMSGVMNNPDVAAVGLIVGFILRWAMSMRKRRGMGGGMNF